MRIEKVLHHPDPPPVETRIYITLTHKEASELMNYLESEHRSSVADELFQSLLDLLEKS